MYFASLMALSDEVFALLPETGAKLKSTNQTVAAGTDDEDIDTKKNRSTAYSLILLFFSQALGLMIAYAFAGFIFRSVEKIDTQNEQAVKVAKRQWKLRAYMSLIVLDIVYVASISYLEFSIENVSHTKAQASTQDEEKVVQLTTFLGTTSNLFVIGVVQAILVHLLLNIQQHQGILEYPAEIRNQPVGYLPSYKNVELRSNLNN